MLSLTHNLLGRYKEVRRQTFKLCDPLVAEDQVIQTMPDVSPTKWHLAHTTWFFENFILKDFFPSYAVFHLQYNYLFNSYYNAVGVRHCRSKRGQISRPTVKEVYGYREYVDAHMELLMEHLRQDQIESFNQIMEIGINHEQQHQELILTDIKHVFACNPLHPVYAQRDLDHHSDVVKLEWIDFDEGIYQIGNKGNSFGFDNEFPSHKVFLQSFRVASRLITNQEFLDFINDDGYQRPEFWLSDGWDMVQQQKWIAPLYWDNLNGEWFNMTLNGFHPIEPSAPVCHVSFYEACAFANWSGHRLLTENEWEIAANYKPIEGNFLESDLFHPVSAQNNPKGIKQLFGDAWEWTSSSYVGYPGYRPAKGALGEYNGKFMSNQMVLRGGSCATAQSHMRATYRNFFAPWTRWQFAGIRLGDNL